MKTGYKKYWVYIGQVNQMRVQVEARSPAEASHKGIRKWRREEAHADVLIVEEVKEVAR